MNYWLSYGGGVNSTALAILLIEGRFPQYLPFNILFSDTGDEQEETYKYLWEHFVPYLDRHGKTLHFVHPKETVLERWQRIAVTGSRIIRSCTDKAKIQPINRYLKQQSTPITQLIGIAADELHRARPSAPTDDFPKLYPLVDADIDRDGCERIIVAAGLPVPVKSGCWHCPFLRQRQILDLAINDPCKFEKIVQLEAAATLKHPPEPGRKRTHWGDRTALEWKERALGGVMFADKFDDDNVPCVCFDG